jgi:transcriptional adapter 2-alpha
VRNCPEDHPSERALKLEVIQIYNKKLDERNKRKRFAIDRGLVDFKKQQQQERKRTKEERDLVARLRIFARFQTIKTAEEREALARPDGVRAQQRGIEG